MPLPDLATPLCDVTFVVLDVETTGGIPGFDQITEIGALKVRGGELLGHIDTLVNPGVPIPPEITVLTGITESMVLPAPPIREVLPSLLEFLHGAVLVGHNVRFDAAFLDAALAAHGYPPLANLRVDTLALARRFVRDELPNLKLGTLAAYFDTRAVPVHRAYADAAATTELLHTLLERAAGYGVFGLDDLLDAPRIRAGAGAHKIMLTARLPRAPGVYLLRDRRGRPLYVGSASNLRAHIRSYFYGEPRAAVAQLLRETARIDHRVCAGPIEATVRQLRAIQRMQPRFNRQTYAWKKSVYLRGTRVARSPHKGALGPFPSARVARRARHREDALARMRLRLDAVEEIRRVPHLVFDAPEGSIELRYGRMVLPGDTRPTPEVNLDLPPRRDELDELLVLARAYRRAAVGVGLAAVVGA